jgi:hypothetical protein
VNNTLALVAQTKIDETEVLDVLLQGHALYSGVFFFNEGRKVFQGFSRGCWDILYTHELVQGYGN